MSTPLLSRSGPWLAFTIMALLSVLHAHAATIRITSLSDDDQPDDFCTLREAIIAANTNAFYRGCGAGNTADEIVWLLPGTVVLASDLPIITSGVAIRGIGVNVTHVDGSGQFRIFEFPGPASGDDALLIEHLRLSGGLNSDGGAISVGNGRSLRVLDSKLDGNTASNTGGAVQASQASAVDIQRSSIIENLAANGSGGGISVFDGNLSVIESTVAGNAASLGSGGGIEAYTVQALLVDRSTLSGNRAGAHGGGLQFVGNAANGDGAVVRSTTIIGNVADADNSDHGFGGGIDVAGPVTLILTNSVVAGNRALVTTSVDCPDIDVRLNAALDSQGFNAVGSNACVTTALAPGLPNANNDFVGTEAAVLDPQLGPLLMNGGATATHLPLPGSLLLDQGSCATEIQDQRGMQNPLTGLRVVDEPAIGNLADGCDIGSVEGSGSPSDLLFRDGFE